MKLLTRSAFIIVAVVVAIAAVLLMFSGSGEEESLVQREAKTLPEENPILPEDTLEDTLEDTVEKPDRPLSLSPGHARLEITVTDISDGRLSAEVNRVLGYGSSTKPIASGQQLTIDAGTWLENNPGDSADIKGRRHQATVSMRQSPELGDDTDRSDISGGAQWVLVRLGEELK